MEVGVAEPFTKDWENDMIKQFEVAFKTWATYTGSQSSEQGRLIHPKPSCSEDQNVTSRCSQYTMRAPDIFKCSTTSEPRVPISLSKS